VYVKRTINRNSGWGVLVGWARSDALGPWFYQLVVRGVQHPGAWSDVYLSCQWNRRPHYAPETIRFGWGGNRSQFYDRARSWEPPSGGGRDWSEGPVDLTPFWKIAQEVRRCKVGEPLIDWLREFGPSEIQAFLEEGIPDVRKILTASQNKEFADAPADVLVYDRVAPV
jgi:hypothetical protein